MSLKNKLLPQHEAALKASAISAKVWQARGYASFTTAAELKRLGFGEKQRQVPTLYIPAWSVSGEVVLHHHRPDVPRHDAQSGKIIKYEFPRGANMIVDVHPHIRDKVRDPRVPLLVTEGVKKADSAISAGACCIALLGVWNWRGTNEHGGKTVLPDWDGIALKGRNDEARTVYICFDSDAMFKRPVYDALVRLAAFLKSKGARVLYIYLPHGADGSKVGLDDFLAAGHTLNSVYDLATPELKSLPSDEQTRVSYENTASGLIWNKPTRDGVQPTPLSNFSARIIGEVFEDDAVNMKRFFEIEASCRGKSRTFTLWGNDFSSMNWPLEQLGADAYIFPGQGLRDHARVAIQQLSNDKTVRHLYVHTGWRQIEGEWVYLHGDGAVGVDGAHPLQDVGVRLPANLQPFRLPAPPVGEELRIAVRASLRLLEAGPDTVMLPLLAAVMRSVMGTTDFSVNIVGPSNSFKSEAAALAQQHFGAEFSSRCFPTSWSSTDNSIEAVAYAAKDAVMVVDDFAPCGSSHDVQRYHAKAERVLRAQGNNAGRDRMNADGTLRVAKFPRGLILSTGEDVPKGHSLRSRQLILEVGPGDINASLLTLCQKDGHEGRLAKAMSGFIAYLAPDYGDRRDRLRSQVEALRQSAQGTGRRTSEIVANLHIDWNAFVEFALGVEAITSADAQDLLRRAENAFESARDAQASHQSANDPVARFVELLSEALTSAQGHLAALDGTLPSKPEAWGWRRIAVGSTSEWRAQGRHLGFVDGDDLYLFPVAAYGVAKRLGEESSDGLVISPKTLHKRLHERGLLASTEETTRGTLLVRKVLQGQRQNVLHLRAATLRCASTDQSDQPAHIADPMPQRKAATLPPRADDLLSPLTSNETPIEAAEHQSTGRNGHQQWQRIRIRP